MREITIYNIGAQHFHSKSIDLLQ